MFVNITAPEDYTAVNVLLSFNASNNVACTTIDIIDDSFVENDETFTVTLDSVGNNVVISNKTGTVTILDDDGNLTAGSYNYNMYMYLQR